MTSPNQRNSFVLYTDNAENLEPLSSEQRGLLFTAIFDYQKNGNLPSDPLIRIALSPFIAQFKRDSQKYQKSCEEKSYASKLGNLKRWRPELYKKVIDGDFTLDEVMKGLDNKALSQPDPIRSTPIDPDPTRSQTSQMIHDSDNVSVNDNNKNIIIHKSELKNISAIDQDFEDFWINYIPVETSSGMTPKGIKKDAKKAYEKVRKKNSHQQIMSALQNYLQTCSKFNSYTKHASSWLNKADFEIEQDNGIRIISERKSQQSQQPRKQNNSDSYLDFLTRGRDGK